MKYITLMIAALMLAACSTAPSDINDWEYITIIDGGVNLGNGEGYVDVSNQ